MTLSPLFDPRRIDRLLAALDEAEAHFERLEGSVLTIVGRHGLRRTRADRALVDEMVAADLIEVLTNTRVPAGVSYALSRAGRARLRRKSGGSDAVDPFRRQHGALEHRLDENGKAMIVETSESPLAWLARRRDRNGRPLLSAARFAAGERLRGDFTLARMMPTVTSNWSAERIGSGKGAGGRGGLLDLTDRALAARDRVRTALDAVGNELADLLVDVCCFLKGLETIEGRRHWPARSAKVVLDIALGRLADHYGLSEEARGPDRARRSRMWGSADYRPVPRSADAASVADAAG